MDTINRQADDYIDFFMIIAFFFFLKFTWRRLAGQDTKDDKKGNCVIHFPK